MKPFVSEGHHPGRYTTRRGRGRVGDAEYVLANGRVSHGSSFDGDGGYGSDWYGSRGPVESVGPGACYPGRYQSRTYHFSRGPHYRRRVVANIEATC